MSITNFGQAWPSSFSADASGSGSGLDGVTITNSSTATGAAITIQNSTSGSEQLDVELVLVFTFPNNAPTGTVTIYILRQTPAGYQATTDPNVYSFAFTPNQNVAGQNVPFTIPGSEMGGFKIAVSNASGFSMTSVTLYNRVSNGQVG